MENSKGEVLPIILGIVLFTILFITVMIEIERNAYKQGQIDALTGKIVYELVVNTDSTKTWERIK